MYRISEISLALNGSEADLEEQAAIRLKVDSKEIRSIKLYKKSIDARKKSDVHFICTVEVDCDKNNSPEDKKIIQVEPYHYELPVGSARASRPVVIGFGPAGIFAALILAQAGQRPIVFERGGSVEKRSGQVAHFWKTGELNSNSNVQFGEGGAGTFSDGKLNTGTRDSRSRKVLEEFVLAGAPQ